MQKLMLASLFLATACAEPVQDETAEVDQSLSTYRRALFFSDETMTVMVGERSSLCTSTTNWGVRTPWVYRDSGSCEWDYSVGPAQWPVPGASASCECCYDSDGNGSCGGAEVGSYHLCSASYGCW